MVVCNPPYISSQRVSEMPAEISDYEPTLAFDGGPFGLSILFRLITETPLYLKSGGWLCFEVGLVKETMWEM
jgi:release factor glutamine methyltransferase